MAPKVIRDMMQGIRYRTEGLTTYNGDPILNEVNTYQSLVEFIGFTPLEVSERYEANTRLKNAERAVMDERRSILRDIRLDVRKGEGISERNLAKLREFNTEYPEYPITGDTIRRSIRAAEQNSQNNRGGISLNQRLDQRLRNEAAALL